MHMSTMQMHCELTIVVGMAILAGNTGERKSKADAFGKHMLCLYAIFAAQNRSLTQPASATNPTYRFCLHLSTVVACLCMQICFAL